MTVADRVLASRVAKVRRYARRRIERARRQEAKWGRVGAHAAITERDVLVHVLLLLDGAEKP